METLKNFVAMAGTQKNAAQLAGIHESVLSRILSGKAALTLAVARRIESASEGRFLATELLGLNTAHAKRRKVA